MASTAASPGRTRAAAAAGRGFGGHAPNRLMFFLMILFFVLEYARPAGLAALRLQMIIVVLFPIAWVAMSERPWNRVLTWQVYLMSLCAFAVFIGFNNFSAYLAARTMFGYIAIAIGIVWLASNLETLREAIWAWVAIMLYTAFFAISAGGVGPGGIVGDENDLSLACCAAFPFAFFGFERLGGWKRWVAGAAGVVFAMAIVVSFSRGGFVGFAAVVAYCLLTSRRKLLNIGVLTVGAIAFFGLAPADYIAEIQTIQNTESGTAETRRFLWETATLMWQDNPIFGVGPASFNFLAGQYQPFDFEGRSWSGTTTHSLYYQLLAEMGLTGVLGYLGILWCHFMGIRRLRKDVRKDPSATPELKRDVELYGPALGGAMIGFLAAGAFVSVAYYPYLFYFSAFAAALDVGARSRLATSAPPAAAQAP